jgi:hypothetical protein
MIDLKARLLQKLGQKQLAHFYILRCSDYDYLKSWTSELVLEGAKSIAEHPDKIKTIENTPDLLWLEKNPGENYKVQDNEIKSFFNFIDYRSFELPHRFAVIADGAAITQIVANKLLKTLEEPPENLTIICLMPMGVKAIQTIESRAIELKLIAPGGDNTSQHTVIEPSAERFKQVEKAKKSEDDFISQYLEALSTNPGSGQSAKDQLSSLKDYGLNKVYHNSVNGRLWKLCYDFTKSHKN